MLGCWFSLLLLLLVSLAYAYVAKKKKKQFPLLHYHSAAFPTGVIVHNYCAVDAFIHSTTYLKQNRTGIMPLALMSLIKNRT